MISIFFRENFEKFHIDSTDLQLVDQIDKALSSEETNWSTFEQYLKG